jgi:type IV pilus assembly protein PilM
MGLPFFDGGSQKKRDQILAVDLGGRITKAVHLQRRGDAFALCGYAILDAPIFEKTISADLLAEHLKAVSQALPTKGKLVSLTLSANDALVRPVEMPRVPMDELRLILKNNSRNYLQQDLVNHVFDCFVLPADYQPKTPESKGAAGAAQKQKLLVTSAKKQLIDEFVNGAKAAGLAADWILPGILGPVNAFEMAMPEVFSKQLVALVDIGFKNSSICLLQQGDLVLNRIVGVGGDRLTTSISESMNISYAEAEGIKIGMPQEVQPAMESILTPLGRELRASIDFFEHQQDKVVSQVFVSGGSSRSPIILQSLQTELMVECKTWNPASFLRPELTPDQTANLEEAGPQLAVAIGAALAAL